jgi:uncharacterized SAM-binding protein YcdF (DUF218 family)
MASAIFTAKSQNGCNHVFRFILVYLLSPYFVVCALLLTAMFVRNPARKKKLLLTGILLLFFFSNEFIANEAMRAWEIPITLYKDMKKDYEWAIILTGVTRHEEGQHDRVFFSRGADRVTHTVQLYKMGKVKKILVSGGSGKLTSIERKEAEDVSDALQLMGVPQADIVIEVNSRNTHESAVEVKKILDGKTTPEQCLLVTSGYHMRRSAACFAKVGWRMDSFTVDFLSHRRFFTPDVLLIPKMEAMGNWQILIREWIGMISYKLAGYI